MKKSYNLLLLLLSFSFYGQIVSIPDANFKNALVNTNCAIISGQFGLTDVDIDNDGEIQQSEALMVNTLYLSHFDIASLMGISYFSNLQYLICPGNLLQELDLAGLSQMAYLECDDNMLTSLDLSTLSALTDVYCENNLLTTLLLPTLPIHNTFGLDCSGNQLTQLDLGTFRFGNLDISYNNLSQIEIPYLGFCETINISGNQYTSIALSAGEILDLYCTDTQLTNLDLSNVDYFHYYMDISNNSSLQKINMQNDRADFCFDYPGDENGPPEYCPFFPGINNNPSLSLICVDAVSLYNYSAQTVVSETEYYEALVNDSDVMVSTECMLATPEIKNPSAITLYPNPAQNAVNIITDNITVIQSIILYNPLGQIIKTVSSNALSASTPIDVSSLNAGTYFMEIISNQGKTTKKFVKL